MGTVLVGIDGSDSAAEAAVSLRSIVADVQIAEGKGKPADVLVEEAERLGAALIVVGNRRVQGPTRVLGAIATSVAHRAPCDVYIVKTT